MSILVDEFIIVNPAKAIWRFKINVKNLTIEKPKDFAKNFNNKKIVFALVCADVDEITITNDFVISIVFEQIKKYSKQFDDKKTELLFKQKNSYHTIDLIKNQKSPFMALYNLFQKKLAELRRYLKNVLIKD